MARTRLPHTYYRLVEQLPLTHIRDDKQMAAAQAMIDQLLQSRLDKGAQEYLDALTDLVEVYEEERTPMPDASEAEVLRELMRSHGLSQARLAQAVGVSQSTLSAVLTGERSLTKGQVVTLARFFHVSPSAFLSK